MNPDKLPHTSETLLQWNPETRTYEKVESWQEAPGNPLGIMLVIVGGVVALTVSVLLLGPGVTGCILIASGLMRILTR